MAWGRMLKKIGKAAIPLGAGLGAAAVMAGSGGAINPLTAAGFGGKLMAAGKLAGVGSTALSGIKKGGEQFQEDEEEERQRQENQAMLIRALRGGFSR